MRKGFTLIEAMIVLSIIAILGAVLVPGIVKNMNDARISRAKDDVQTLGKMMLQARDDMGIWTTVNRNNQNSALLIGTSPDPDASAIPLSNTGISSWNRTPMESFWWELVNVNNSYKKIDTNPHNLPSWKGAYLTEIKLDPWGNPYLSNVAYLSNGSTPDNTRKVWIISAGTNNLMDTNFEGTALQTGGDDIGFAIQ